MSDNKPWYPAFPGQKPPVVHVQPPFPHAVGPKKEIPQKEKDALLNKLLAAKPKRRPQALQAAIANISREQERPIFIPTFDDRTIAAVEPIFEPPPILYEGNLETWLPAIKAMLAAYQKAGFHGFGGLEAVQARLVKPYIRPELFNRVPTELSSNIHTLGAALTKLVEKNFRLMDLSAKVRARIFENVVKSEVVVVLFNRRDVGVELREGVEYAKQPALTMTSRRVREESMPMYLQTNAFAMNLEMPLQQMEQKLHFGEVFKWARANKRWLGSLRRLSVGVKFRGTNFVRDQIDFGVAFEPQEGLKVTIDERLEKYHGGRVGGVENYRKVHEIEGQAVAMFFVEQEKWADLLLLDVEGFEDGGMQAQTDMEMGDA